MLGGGFSGIGYAAFLYGPFEGEFPAYLGADLVLTPSDGFVASIVPVGDADGDGADDVLLGIAENDINLVRSDLILGLPSVGGW